MMTCSIKNRSICVSVTIFLAVLVPAFGAECQGFPKLELIGHESFSTELTRDLNDSEELVSRFSQIVDQYVERGNDESLLHVGEYLHHYRDFEYRIQLVNTFGEKIAPYLQHTNEEARHLLLNALGRAVFISDRGTVVSLANLDYLESVSTDALKLQSESAKLDALYWLMRIAISDRSRSTEIINLFDDMRKAIYKRGYKPTDMPMLEALENYARSIKDSRSYQSLLLPEDQFPDTVGMGIDEVLDLYDQAESRALTLFLENIIVDRDSLDDVQAILAYLWRHENRLLGRVSAIVMDRAVNSPELYGPSLRAVFDQLVTVLESRHSGSTAVKRGIDTLTIIANKLESRTIERSDIAKLGQSAEFCASIPDWIATNVTELAIDKRLSCYKILKAWPLICPDSHGVIYEFTLDAKVLEKERTDATDRQRKGILEILDAILETPLESLEIEEQ